jgi:hypothetical protein
MTFSSKQGSIPKEIGSLLTLTRLRLSYNEFVGSGVNLFDFQRLEMLHLHGNRLSGIINFTSSSKWNESKWNDLTYISAYISDCGNPSDFKPSLVCDGCTMCCKHVCCSSLSCMHLLYMTSYFVVVLPST